MKKWIAVMVGVGIVAASQFAWAAELTSEPRTFGWQDREYFGVDHSKHQLGGGDATGESASATGGESGGNGESCGDK